MNEYTDYIVRVGRTLGGDEAGLRKKAEDIVQFEKFLTQVRLFSYNNQRLFFKGRRGGLGAGVEGLVCRCDIKT